MKRTPNAFALLAFLFFFVSGYAQKPAADSLSRIQLCLLLDVSGSMKGLLLQAQGQIWKTVSYLSQFHKDGYYPPVEVAVISFGHEGYADSGHIRLACPFTTDIDTLAEALFLMETGGGNEYCGHALQTAMDSLAWQEADEGFKALFIAGNERFDQGSVDFRVACRRADSLQLRLNAFYCGDLEEGADFFWKEAAELGNGGFVTINQDLDIAEMKTPYDNKIATLYQSYRSTFSLGQEKDPANYGFQHREDGTINPIYRDMVLYKVLHEKKRHDLVEEFEKQNWDLKKIKPELIPEGLKPLSPQELGRYLLRKSQERAVTREALQLYSKKVEEYLAVIQAGQEEKTLDLVVREMAAQQLVEKGYRKGE